MRFFSPTSLAVILTPEFVEGKNPRILLFTFIKNKRIVISTEAAHSLIVSGAAEKSASYLLLPQLLSPLLFAFAVASLVVIPEGDLCTPDTSSPRSPRHGAAFDISYEASSRPESRSLIARRSGETPALVLVFVFAFGVRDGLRN